MMILSITLASVVFSLLDEASQENPTEATLTALATTVIVAALMLRGSAMLRLWGPLIGIVGGCIVAFALGIYEFDRVIDAAWIGFPSEVPDLGLDFGIHFWTLLPSFLFLGLINSIQVNGASITNQRAAWREDRAIDFREVQRALTGGGVSNLLAGVGGTVPNVVNPAGASFIQITGVASRRVGYFIGGILLVIAFLPKVSGLDRHHTRSRDDGISHHGDGEPTCRRREDGLPGRAGPAEDCGRGESASGLGQVSNSACSTCPTSAPCGERCSRAA